MGKLIIVAVLSGLGSGLAVAVLLPAEPDAPVAAAVQTDSPTATSRRSELKALEADVRQLRQRVKELEAARPARRGARRVVRTPEQNGTSGNAPVVAAQRAAGPVGHIVEALESDESPLRQAVQGMINDSMENRRQEWRAVRSAHREARDQDRLKGFLDLVDLNDGQTDAMKDALDAERKRMGKEWRSARETMQFEGMRERMRGHRTQTDENLAEVLTDEQFKQWKTYRKDNWGRRRR